MSKEETLRRFRDSEDFDDLDLSLGLAAKMHVGVSYSPGKGLPFVRKIQSQMLDLRPPPTPDHRRLKSENHPRAPNSHRKSHSYHDLSPFVDRLPTRVAFDPSVVQTPRRPPVANRAPSVKVSLTPAQRMEKRPDARNALDNFQFSDLIGKGAFANVYKGHNSKTKQVVAIKQILLEKDQDVRELMGEIDLLKILKHPNIVKYHGFVKTLTSLNVILEFCAGGSLRQLYKKRGAIPEREVVQYVEPILHGLQYLHAQGVVHRDVKAANVLLTDGGVVKLADFGVATKVLNQHHTVVGTPNWMAPETVLGGEGICTASDIWLLGATIIELFTTHPPYHDYNAMATLHAIGTDDHPPLPGLSPTGKDFLLECFQKQPNLRKSAKLLLKHKWIVGPGERRSISQTLPKVELPSKSLGTYTEKEETWDDVDLSKTSKSDLLAKFTEKLDAFDLDVSNLVVNKVVENHDEDPFLQLEIDNFDTNELEIQSKMEFLVSKLMSRLKACRKGNEDAAASMVKITGRMLHLVKKYPSLHGVLIREHAVLLLLELLEHTDELPNQNKLWFHTLLVLNCIFTADLAQFENFCLLGGIPIVTQFRMAAYDMPVRLQVVRFVRLVLLSDRALSMFVSSGGLRVLSKFAEEDYDHSPEFPLVAIDGIHEILSRNLTRYKLDLCRVLSKYGVVFWFVVLLDRLTGDPQLVEKIIAIFKWFANSEPRVRVAISSPDLFKLLIKVYRKLLLPHQLVVLKFFRSISCVTELLKSLHAADILEFLVGVLLVYTPANPKYKEVVNVICPIIFNTCYLNHTKEVELIRLGALPHLKQLSKINLEFRQFVLPIVCELVYCDNYVRMALYKHDMLSIYFNLLVDTYWQANALDSILHWAQTSPKLVNLELAQALNCIMSGFLLPQVSNVESSLENYLKLLTTNEHIRSHMATDAVISATLSKTTSSNPVVQLSLLRILRLLMQSRDETHDVRDHLSRLAQQELPVLVREVMMDVLTSIT